MINFISLKSLKCIQWAKSDTKDKTGFVKRILEKVKNFFKFGWKKIKSFFQAIKNFFTRKKKKIFNSIGKFHLNYGMPPVSLRPNEAKEIEGYRECISKYSSCFSDGKKPSFRPFETIPGKILTGLVL